jgi:hypothetical protein
MLEDNNHRLTHRNRIFTSNTAAVSFLQEKGAIQGVLTCVFCSSPMLLKIYKKNYEETIVYKCKNCSRRKSLFSLCMLINCKVEMCDFLFFAYCYILDIR